MLKQIKQRLFVFQKICSYFSQTLAHMYINAVILSKMSYCLPVWCLTSNETLKPVKLLYNRAYKMCVNVTYHSHHCTALEKATALNLCNYLKLTSMKLYNQIQHNLTPSLISSLLPRLSNTQHRNHSYYHKS